MAEAAPTVRHVAAGKLSADTAQTPGMARSEAISERLTGAHSLWMGQSVMQPGARSGDHHHGATETAIYVQSGHPVFVFVTDGNEHRIEAAPGDYVYVPPFVPHREENPSAQHAVVVMARSTQEAVAVPLDSLFDVRTDPDK